MKETTDTKIIETRKVLLATFIGGRRIEEVPPLSESGPQRDLADWVSALGGETPLEVSRGFVEDGLLELREPILTFRPPGSVLQKTIGLVTEKGAPVVTQLFSDYRRTEWRVESVLGETKAKKALTWVAGASGGAVVGAVTIHLLKELRQLLSDEGRAGIERGEEKRHELGPKGVEEKAAPKDREEIPVVPAPASEPGLLETQAVEPTAATAISLSLIVAKTVGWFRRRR